LKENDNNCLICREEFGHRSDLIDHLCIVHQLLDLYVPSPELLLQKPKPTPEPKAEQRIRRMKMRPKSLMNVIKMDFVVLPKVVVNNNNNVDDQEVSILFKRVPFKPLRREDRGACPRREYLKGAPLR
jgi:hypothetical protein